MLGKSAIGLGLAVFLAALLTSTSNKQTTNFGPLPTGNFVIYILSAVPMDKTAREAFLADIEAEEEFLRVGGKTSSPVASSSAPILNSSLPQQSATPTSTTRRQSAAGRAAQLKSKNLIPPLNPPTDRRLSLPRASKLVHVQSPLSPTIVAAPAPPTMADKQKPPQDFASSMDKITAMFDKIREDIAKSETSTANKIDAKVDDLSSRITARLTKAEGDLSRLGGQIALGRSDIDDMKNKMEGQEQRMVELVDKAVDRRLGGLPMEGRRPRQTPTTRGNTEQTTSGSTSSVKEERYWEARRSLRIWPVTGENLKLATLSFLHDKLKCTAGRVKPDDIEVTKLTSHPESTAKEQVLVRFSTIRLRDEVKSLGRNLSGLDKSVGMQIEPPDHLRSHYQAFQKMAFQMKKKHPNLRRNIKFLDIETCLVMDVLTSAESGWRTIMYEDARAVLKKTRARTESITLEELEDMVDVAPGGRRKRRRETMDESDDDDDDMDSTIIDLGDDNNKNSDKPSRRSLTFINANARSLGPKVESLFDCFQEKELDLAMLTETWLQDGELDQKISQYSDQYALGCITKNRSDAAVNDRQYGGVALMYRKKTSHFKEFELINPEKYEVLACVGGVNGVRGKLFCLTCYAPPNITAVRAKQMLEYISDVVAEAKRKFTDCSLLVAGDFNQWPVAGLLEEHPDLKEVEHGPTRGERAIDRSLVNFYRSIEESGTLPPLETEDGRESDHKIAWARATFEKTPSKIISYSYRAYTERGATSFLQALSAQDWSEVYNAGSTSNKVLKLQGILDKLMRENFEWKTPTRKESDPPWVNERLLKLIAK